MFQIRLLGGFEALVDGRPLPELQRRRTEEVWSFLLLHEGQRQDRARIAFRLWPDLGEGEARTELRRHLYWLEHHLRANVADETNWVQRDGRAVAWAPTVDHRLDVRDFSALCERCTATATGGSRSAIHHADADDGADDRAGSDLEALSEATATYRGDLLPEYYADWVVPLRRRLRAQAMEVLDRLVDRLASRGRVRRAIRACERLVELDPLREEGHRRLMELHVAAGDRVAALRQFRTCRQALREQLDVAPMPETLMLYRAIRSDTVLSPAPGVEPNRPITGVREAAIRPVASRGDRLRPPRPVGRFVGRETDLEAASEALRRHACVCLTGPGGVGKSRLAVELVLRPSAETSAGGYGEGAVGGPGSLWLDLSGLRGHRGAERLLRSLDWAEPNGFGVAHVPDQDEGMTLGHVAERVLWRDAGCVVLDDCDPDGPADVLADLLLRGAEARGTCLKVLVTGRAPLRSAGSAVVRLHPLRRRPSGEPDKPDDAAALLLDRADLTGARLAAAPEILQAADRICACLDGLPLALELAAERLADIPPLELAARLESDAGLALLASQSTDRPARQRSLLASFEHDDAALEDDERSALRCLAAFAGQFDPMAAEAMLTGSRDAPLAVVGRLARRSLVEVDHRALRPYRLLSPTRAFAWRAAVREGLAPPLASAHARIVVERAEREARRLIGARTAPPAPSEWSAEDALEMGLAMRRLERAEVPHRMELALRLASARRHRWILNGSAGSERRWLESMLARMAEDAPGEPGPAVGPAAIGGASSDHASDGAWNHTLEGGELGILLARARMAAGVADYLDGDHAAALAHYADSLAWFEANGPELEHAELLDHIAAVKGLMGRTEPARSLCRFAIALKQRSGTPAEIADTWSVLGDIALFQGDMVTAEGHYSEALAVLRHVAGQRPSLLNVLRGMGIVALHRRAMSDARAYLEEGLALSRAWRDERGEAVCLNELGCLHLEAGNFDAAQTDFRGALEIHQRQGADQRAAMVLNNLGEVAVLRGEPELGRYYFAQSMRHARSASSDPRRINTLTNLAEVHTFLGQPLHARQLAQEAIDLAHRLGDARLEAHTRFAGALESFAAGDPPRCAAHLAACLEIARNAHDGDRVARALALCVCLMAEEGDIAAAGKLLEKAGASLDSGTRSPFERAALAKAMRRVKNAGRRARRLRAKTSEPAESTAAPEARMAPSPEANAGATSERADNGAAFGPALIAASWLLRAAGDLATTAGATVRATTPDRGGGPVAPPDIAQQS